MGQTNCYSNHESHNIELTMKSNDSKAKKMKKQNKAHAGANLHSQSRINLLEDADDAGSTMSDELIFSEPNDNKSVDLTTQRIMIDDVGYDQEDFKLLRDSRSKAADLYQMLSSKQWNLADDTEDVKLYILGKTTGESSEIILKRTTIVKASPATAFFVLSDIDKIKATDSSIKKLDVVKELPLDSRLIYRLNKSTLLYSCRDFVTCNSNLKLDDGTYIISSHSVLSPIQPPKGCVRGNLGGLTEIKSVGEDQTKISEIIVLDMITDLPSTVLKRMTFKYHEQFVKLRRDIQKTAKFFKDVNFE